jgi:hypothetical protein
MRYAYCALRNIRFYETSGSGHSRRIKGGRRKSASPPIASAPSRDNEAVNSAPNRNTSDACGPLPLRINIVMAALVRACPGRARLSPPQISVP